MLEITKKNCYKFDLETINDSSNQHFWVNLRNFEVETERNWINIFNKYGNSSNLKQRKEKELTPNIQFQPYKFFVRDDLFEQVIKSCKATNAEFLMLKEKVGLCPYKNICDEQEFILMSKIQDTNKKLIDQSDDELIEQADDELIEQSHDELINNQMMN